MASGYPVSYLDYSGGLNTQDAPYLLEANQCRDALNVHTSSSGDMEKRTGFVTFNDTTLAGSPCNATGIHTLFPANTATKSLVGVVTTKTTDSIVKLTTGGVASNLKTGLTANTRWYFAQADVNASAGPIFGMNGVDTPQLWDGSASGTSDWVATTGTVPATAKFLTYFGQRLWCAAGSRLYFSGITGSTTDPLNWDSSNYVDLEPNDGQSITGIGSIGSYLIVFKQRKVFQIYDITSAANRQISSSLGTIAPRSVVQTPNGLFFLSEDQGVCLTDGVKVTPFSDQIKPTIDSVLDSPATAALAAGTLEGRRYFLSVSINGTANDHTLEYDLVTRSWWLHDCASNDYALSDPGGTPTLYSADAGATRVSQAFVNGTYTDNGSKYAGTSYLVSPYYAWSTIGLARGRGRYLNPHMNKRLSAIRIDGVGNWNLYQTTDFLEDFTLLDGMVWESAGDPPRWGVDGDFGGSGTFGPTLDLVTERRYPTPGKGRSFSYKYLNDDTDNFKVFSSTFHLVARSD